MIQFLRGLKKFYSVEKYKDAIYFATDTNEIIVNGEKYGFNPKDPDLKLVSLVEQTAPGTFLFTLSNGEFYTLAIGEATEESAGLMSAEDKRVFNAIPETYATKEELATAITGTFHFRGKVNNLSELPTEGMKEGDSYQVLEAFEIDGNRYAEGSFVAWTGTEWVAIEGEEPGYSKEQADDRFVPWSWLPNGKKVIRIPLESKLLGMAILNGVEEEMNVAQVAQYGEFVLTELGSAKVHMNLNSLDRVTVEGKDNKEELAYVSDISWKDINA